MKLAYAPRERGKAVFAQRRQDDLKSRPLKEALTVWQTKRAAIGGLPAVTDFDILDYPQVMRNTSLIDVRAAPLDFVYRLHSMTGAEYAGLDMTGRSLQDYPDPQYRCLFWEAAKRAVLKETAQLVIEDVLVRRAFNSRELLVRLEAVLLPHQDGEGNVTRLVAVFDLLRPS
mgnify:CR=1 FL=1